MTIVVEKFNPYHGKDGRFTGPNGATSFTIASGKENAKRYIQSAVENEKARTESLTNETLSQKMKNMYKDTGIDFFIISQSIENLPEQERKVFNAFAQTYVSDVVVNGKSYSHYTPTESRITYKNANEVNAGDSIHEAGEVFLHETAHAISNAYMQWTTPESVFQNRPWWDATPYWKEGKFPKTIKQETTEFFKNKQAEYQQETGKKFTIQQTRDEFRKRLNANGVSKKESGNVEDIFMLATNRAYHGRVGHTSTYAKYQYSEGVEAFAHFFSASATNKKAFEYMKTCLPKSYAVYQEMINDMIDSYF